MFPLGTKGLDSKVKKVSWVQRLTQICRREIWNSESELWQLRQEIRALPQVECGHRCTDECALSSVKQTNKHKKYRGVVWLGLEPN